MPLTASAPVRRLSLTGLRTDPLTTLAPLQRADADLVRAVAGRQPLAYLRAPAPIEDLLVRRHDAFGKVNEIRAATRTRYGFEPRGALIFSDDREEHLVTRKAIAPEFSGESLARIADVVAALSGEIVDGWRTGARVDAGAAGSRLAVEATMRTLFAGSDADGHGLAGDIDALMRDDRLFPGHRRAYPPDAPERFARVSSGFAGVMADAEAGRPGVPPRLRAVAEARAVDGGAAAMTAAGVFAAGVETTVHALAYALGLLAERPDVQAWLAEEVDEVVGGSALRGEDAARLPRCRAAFAETLRLYPPSWFIARWTKADVELGGEPVAAGTTVLVCPYLVHRDARFFADPDAYRPARWTDGSAPPRLAYIPFGAGRRQCLGERIAWAEGTLLLAAVAARFTLGPAGSLPPPVAGAALRPARPVLVHVSARGA